MTHTTRITQLRRDERGFSLVTIGLSLIALFGASMLAIDVGMLMWARTQAQVSADAGALAGATALVFNSFSDRSATGPAVTSAINTAKSNAVVGAQPSVIPEDVTFPFDTVTGQNDQVQVIVHRTTERGNPLSTHIAAFFSMPTASVRATATAVAYPADAATCVLPFTLPDRWDEHSRCGAGTCTWTTDDTFEIYERQGQQYNQGPPLPYPDVYIPPSLDGPPTTGYNANRDKGLRLALKAGNDSKVAPSIYNPWGIGGGTGADYYRENISGCNTTLVGNGEMLVPETGNMTGPTQQGTDGLIAADPNAYWDEVCNCVKGSAYPISPRIRPIPLYNPKTYAEGRQTGKSGPQFEMVNLLGFFVESITGNEVIGRIHPITGQLRNPNSPPIGAFASAILLIK